MPGDDASCILNSSSSRVSGPNASHCAMCRQESAMELMQGERRALTPLHRTGRMRQNEAEFILIKVLCASSSQCFSFTPCRSLSLSSLRLAFLFASIFVSSFCFCYFDFAFFNVSIKTCEPNENPYHVTILLSSCLTSVRTFFQIGFSTVIWFRDGDAASAAAAVLVVYSPCVTYCSRFRCFISLVWLCCVRLDFAHAVFCAHRFGSFLLYMFLFLKDYLDYLVWDELMSWDAVLRWVCAWSISHVQVFIDEGGGGGAGVAWQQLVRCTTTVPVYLCAFVCLDKALEAFLWFSIFLWSDHHRKSQTICCFRIS